MNIMALTDLKGGGLDRFLTKFCGSLRFQRFSLGCRKRMGQDWRPNRAISDPIMLKRLALTESKVRLATHSAKRLSFIMAGAFFCFCYVVSLRSPEGLMVYIPGLTLYGK